jgi:carboxyl-terminal processing protease
LRRCGVDERQGAVTMRMAWIVAPVIGLATGMGALAWSAQQNAAPRSDTYRQLELFADVLVRVKADYVTDVDDQEVMKSAIQGMLSALDPHSTYLTAQEFKDMQVQTRGEYTGLGIEVTMEDGVVKVVSPIDDTPASRAGIQPGDFLTAINGESIVGLSINEAVSRMRGPAGTSITVTVARSGREPFDVTLNREIVAVRSVVARVEDDIGFIRVSTFNEKTAAALEQGVRQVKSESRGHLQGVILDLRNNPGGLLEQAIEVSGAFLDGGEVVSTRGRHPEDIQRYNADRGDTMPGVPIVVLINGGSASASEIVAGALQDRGRAIVVGTTSFGKGSVQTVIPLKQGKDGAVRLTTARYYTPAGRSIQAAGIEPDIEIAAVRVDPANLKKDGFSEGDLRNALGNETGAKRRGAHVPEDQPPPDWDPKQDYQIKRAKDLLKQGIVAQQLQAKAG